MLDSWIMAIVFVVSFSYAVWYVADLSEHPRMSRRDIEDRIGERRIDKPW